MDGAPYHCSSEMFSVYRRLNIPIVILGPYSYSGAPVERAFAFLKRTNINADGYPVTGSK